MRVALVVMPLAAADRPSLAAGLLKAGLRRRGVECDVKYFNLTLWKMLGAEAYRYLSQEVSTPALAGEWAFSRLLGGAETSTWESYRDEVLRDPVFGISRDDDRHVLALAGTAPVFLRVALEACDWGEYRLVGFTSTFEQTAASLWLARAIKQRHPGVAIALGGANFEGPMGRPYLEAFPFVDYVATGESDHSFPALCEALRDGRDDVPPGILCRRGIEAPSPARPAPAAVTDLDALPVPDYDDYFQVLASVGGPARSEGFLPWLPLEASRGCFWGERSPCTFCGLNGDSRAFRAKSGARVVAEADALLSRHGPLPLHLADNVAGEPFLRDVVPAWASRTAPPRSFVEVRATLSRGELARLRDAGVASLQPGIESFSDSTLRLMQKGVTGARNVAVLRWCEELGVVALWNLLYGFPREDPADYPATLALMKKLVHLRPPTAVAPIRLDRFSPHFEDPAAHGFTEVAPMPAYRHVFGLPEESLARMAVYFRYRHPRFAGVLAEGAPLAALFREWRRRSEVGTRGELRVLGAPPGPCRLLDTRFTREPSEVSLSHEERAILLAADAPGTRESVLARASRALPGVPVPALGGALDRLLSCDAVAAVGPRLVTLAVLDDGCRLGTDAGIDWKDTPEE
ncbi:MAG: RiPP maturation radical SAM protein 1 [Acidobacteria bacterium]|nr:MAG: RiPP maturation radical SAM protein 1 [Acidobacteriota bacterium]